MFTVREMYSGQYSLLHANLESQDAHSLPLFYFESASLVLKKKISGDIHENTNFTLMFF